MCFLRKIFGLKCAEAKPDETTEDEPKDKDTNTQRARREEIQQMSSTRRRLTDSIAEKAQQLRERFESDTGEVKTT